MLIKKVEACTVVIPLDNPTSFSTRTINERHYTLVRLKTKDGVEGIGYTYVGNKAGHLATLAVRDLLRANVVGKNTDDVEGIWDAMFSDSLLHGRRGVVMRALSAIDIAIWDARAKAVGKPLYKLLGGTRKQVPAYASGGYYKPGKSLADLQKETRSYADSGFTAIKMKVGRASGEEDAKRIGAVREATGPKVQLFVDANNAWTDASEAIRIVKLWERHNIGWVEEPSMPDDLDLSAAVAKAVRTPIATGEIEATRWGFKSIIDKKAASILQPEAHVCGGITEFIRIARIAAVHKLTIAPHWFAELHAHLVAATPNATWVEYFTDDAVLNVKRVFASDLEVRKGNIVLPETPGHGITLDNKAVERFAVDKWS